MQLPANWQSWPQQKKLQFLERLRQRQEELKKQAQSAKVVPIYEALTAAEKARNLIPVEQERLTALLEQETDPVRREFIEYQRDLVAWQLNRAADIAEARRTYIERIKTKDDQQAEKDLCKRDTLHWFRYWAWTIDPRSDSPLNVLPFEPFEFQETSIHWLDNLVFVERRGGVQEKSRDMGATWINVCWALHKWLFVPYFQCLFSSRTEDEVDSRKEPDSIFEKLRFGLRYLPQWMLPGAFNWRTDATFATLANPDNGSVISGGAPVVDLGRGGRYTVAFLDEFASFPHGGNPQYTSLSQSTRSVIVTSTPKGKANRFYQLRSQPQMPVYTFHWEKHPWKDWRWRKGQELSMKPYEIAQEVEIDYEASETGQLLREFDEFIHVITWTEFARFFGEQAYAIKEDGRRTPRLPATWRIGVGQDWGETIGHPCATVWIARPAERDPLSDCLFVYRELIRPEWPNTPQDWEPPTARRIANEIWTLEQPWKERDRVDLRLMSAEAGDVRRIYRREQKAQDLLPLHLHLNFNPWVARNNYGFPQLQQLLEVDFDRSNPFRRYPRGHIEEGQPLPGAAHIYFIVDDDQGALYMNEDKQLRVRGAINERGLARLRAEIPAKRRETDLAGEERRTDKKIFDDALDALRGILSQFGPEVAPLTKAEQVHSLMKERGQVLEPEQLTSMDPAAQAMAIVAQMQAFRKALKDADSGESPVVNFRYQIGDDDDGNSPRF